MKKIKRILIVKDHALKYNDHADFNELCLTRAINYKIWVLLHGDNSSKITKKKTC